MSPDPRGAATRGTRVGVIAAVLVAAATVAALPSANASTPESAPFDDYSFAWVQPVTGPDEERTQNVVADRAGNTYVVGEFGRSATFGSGPNRQTISGGQAPTPYVAKYGANGSLLWVRHPTRSHQNERPLTNVNLTLDSLGNIVIGGVFQDDLTFTGSMGRVTLNTNAREALFAAKYTPSGALVWAKKLSSGAELTWGMGMLPATGGDIVIEASLFRGTFAPGSPLSAGAFTHQRYFVARLDPAGEVRWVRKDLASYVALLATQGGRTLIRSTERPEDAPPVEAPAARPQEGASRNTEFLTLLDPTGATVWTRQFTDDRARESIGHAAAAAAFAPDGSIRIAGTFWVTLTIEGGPTDLRSAGQHDGYVARISRQGTTQWFSRIHGTGNDSTGGVIVDSNGRSIVVADAGMGTTVGEGPRQRRLPQRRRVLVRYRANGTLVGLHNLNGLRDLRAALGPDDTTLHLVGGWDDERDNLGPLLLTPAPPPPSCCYDSGAVVTIRLPRV